MKLHEWLVKNGGCEDGVGWLGDRGPRTAILLCPRGDWLCWLLGSLDQKAGVLAACISIKHVLADNQMPDNASLVLDDLMHWARGNPVDDDHMVLVESFTKAILLEHKHSATWLKSTAEALGWAEAGTRALRPKWRGECASRAAAHAVVSAALMVSGDPKAYALELSRFQADAIRREFSADKVEHMWKRQRRAHVGGRVVLGSPSGVLL